jgi:hypothetical protein
MKFRVYRARIQSSLLHFILPSSFFSYPNEGNLEQIEQQTLTGDGFRVTWNKDKGVYD